MLRKVLLAMGVGLCLSPLGTGCSTREPVIWSEPHLKRHALTFLDGFSHPTPLNPIPFDGTHDAIDRIFYGIDPQPNESWSDHLGREGMSFYKGFHRFHMDFDRIILDMPEYPLESEY
jgi:hypothetical protein